MANTDDPAPIIKPWKNFVKCLRKLLDIKPKRDRFLNAYLGFRDRVLDLAVNERFLSELDTGWKATFHSNLTGSQEEIASMLLMEVGSFPGGVELSKAGKSSEEAKEATKRDLGRASIIIGSVKDLVDNLPWYAKGVLTLLKELVDLFKG